MDIPPLNKKASTEIRLIQRKLGDAYMKFND